MKKLFPNNHWVPIEFTGKWHYRDEEGKFICGFKTDRDDNEWNLLHKPDPEIRDMCKKCRLKLMDLI